MKGKEKAEKRLTRAMHNGERRNPLAGVPRNKYVSFVLVRRLVGRRENERMTEKGVSEYRALRNEDARAEMNGDWTNISSSSLSSLKRLRRRAAFSRDIIHYLKRPLSLSQPS